MGKSLRGSSTNYKAKIKRQVRRNRKGAAGGKWKKTRASSDADNRKTHRSKKKERQYRTRMKNLAQAELKRKADAEAAKLAGSKMVE